MLGDDGERRCRQEVVNVGHPPKGPLLALTDADWEAGFAMTFLPLVRVARLVTPQFRAAGGGAMVAISSYAAFEPELAAPLGAGARTMPCSTRSHRMCRRRCGLPP